MTGSTLAFSRIVARATIDLAEARRLLGHAQADRPLLVDFAAVESVTADALQHLRVNSRQSAGAWHAVLLSNPRPQISLLLRLVGLQPVTVADTAGCGVAA